MNKDKDINIFIEFITTLGCKPHLLTLNTFYT